MSQDRDSTAVPTAVPGASGDATRTLTEPGPASASSSSGALDGARFVPGTLLAGRYRIVGLLGRGGMGEVYRAEDLKLGEPVALKFLPAELTLDGAALARFHREVRVARQIAHRNVCRVFDIGEAGGLHFLSMEYIDGEDLSGLLKRIGRLPRDKAVELARQICAGLGAAHEVGVLHRDMKPANVMIDGEGRAKITDFGLAQVAGELKEQAEFAGTPAYMAPEQLEAGEVSVKTDLYALGLVLYEMCTGQRAFAEEDDWRQLMARGGHGTPSRPSSHVEGLDPVVEAVILRCLEEDASKRPSSALEVSASLPGGDPLAAALAAGETPSPEMVAAAPEKGLLRPAVAGGLLAALALLIWGGLWARQQTAVDALARLPKSPAVLEDRARTLLRDLGYGEEPADSAWGWQMNLEYIQHLRREGAADRLTRQTGDESRLFQFWYRQSPGSLRPWVFGTWRPTLDDPPHGAPGMATVVLSADGHLIRLRVDPPARERAPAERGAGDSETADWSRLFAAAGLDPEALTPAETRWTPAVYTEGRAAWTGFLPSSPEREPPDPSRPAIAIHVEAGHVQGLPVVFDVWAPWDAPATEVNRGETHLVARILLSVFFVAALTAGVWLARRHLRDGRGDRQGASRLALFTIACLILSWVFGAHHQSGIDGVGFFLSAVAFALFFAAFFWILYLAFEPFLRRRWPEGVVGWNRLLAGEFHDPLVGREVLIGVLLGTAAAASSFLIAAAFGHGGETVIFADKPWPSSLYGFRATLATVLHAHVRGSMMIAFGGIFIFVLLLILLRRKWLAAALYAAAWALVFKGVFDAVFPGLPIFHCLLLAGLFTVATARFGLLTLVSYWFGFSLLIYLPTTTELSSWHAEGTLLTVALTLALGAWSCWAAVGGRPVRW